MNRAVLMVEDLADDTLLLQRSWRIEGVTVPLHCVSDGSKAIAYLAGTGEYSDREKFPTPCLILLDLKLPKLMGLEVLAWIRSNPEWKRIPVIVLTSSALQKDVDEAYRLGANAFLVKPSDVFQLGEMVRLIRDFWLRVNQFPQISSNGNDSHNDIRA